MQVTARFEGMNLGDGMDKVQQAIADLNLPPSIRVQYGGQYEEQQKSFKDLAFVLVLAIVLVFMVLLFEFGNFAAPLAVISSALLSTCGVFLALLVTGTTFNLSSFMGLIMVIGIVAKNGILLLDADQKFRAEGMPRRRGHDPRRRAPPAPHHDDRAGHRGRHASAGARFGRRLANAATSGHRGDRRHPRLDGPFPGGDSGRSLLYRRPERLIGKGVTQMKKILTVALVAAAAFAAEGYKVLNKIKIGGTGGWDYVAVDSANARVFTLRTAPSWKWWTRMPARWWAQITQLHGVHGIAIASDLGKGFITNGQSNSVTIFDLKTLAKTGEPAAGTESRRHLLRAEDQARLHHQWHARNDSTAIDAKTNEIVEHLPGRRQARNSARRMAPASSTSTSKTPAKWWRSMPPSPPSPRRASLAPVRRPVRPGHRREEQEAVLACAATR